ncbi:hypothetical protein BD410DRAFT_781540 [Rickenella mellea]|uniref:Uncharacterized protein n=1 Tax=Rickenella mellea TaxID=50990 RepID=A0A4Y7QNK6_9AGAM|nr:hypothetical protein BD410DRAFT_781540 [Rickenella mellea]
MIMRGVFNAMRPGNTPLNPFLEEVECLGPHWSEVARSVAPMVLSRCNHSTEHSDGALASAISRPHTVKFEDQRIVDEFLGLPGIASCVQKGLAVLRTNEVRSWWCNKGEAVTSFNAGLCDLIWNSSASPTPSCTVVRPSLI